MGFFDKIKAGLTKTREALSNTLGNVFSGFSQIDDDFYDELEESPGTLRRTALPSILSRLWFGSRAVLPLVSRNPRTVIGLFLCLTMCSIAQGCCGKTGTSLFGNRPRSPARPATHPTFPSSLRKRLERWRVSAC